MKCHVSIYAIRMPILCFEHNRQRQRENQQSIEFSNFGITWRCRQARNVLNFRANKFNVELYGLV